MCSNQSSGMPQRPAEVLVTFTELYYAVESLTSGIQSAMRLLYKVRMSLIERLSHPGSPTDILDAFNNIRDLFRAEWAEDNEFLQNFYNYCDEWIDFCDLAAFIPPANQGFVAARDALVSGTIVHTEAREMQSRHEKSHRKLRKLRHGIESVLSSENSRARGTPGVSNSHSLQETLRPSGMDSLTEAYTALSTIYTAMGDIVEFLEDHVNYLKGMVSTRFAAFPIKIPELRASAEKWSHSKSVLLAAMSSISDSSDKVPVDPLVGSHFGSPPLMDSDTPLIPPFVPNSTPNKTDPFKDVVRPKLYSNLLSFIQTKILASEKSEAEEITPCFIDSLMSAIRLMKDLDIVRSLVRSREYHNQLLCLLAELGFRDREALRIALSKDDLQISEALSGILNSEKKAQVLQLKGDDAEKFMVVMLNVMDLDSFRQSDNRANASTCHRLLIKLAEACNTLPSSLNIEGIKQLEREPSGHGGFADIFRGSFCGAQIVALKRLRLMADERLKIQKMFFQEALIWRQLRHPHVLPFLGVDMNTFPGSLCMVSPWLEQGTLSKHLDKIRSLKLNLQILFEVAQGIEYLHSQNIVHGDIRCANVLIDDGWRPRLADFGLAVFADATAGANSPSRRGAVRWMAPELLNPQDFGQRTPASDIYAYACLCYEVYTGHSPLSEITSDIKVALSVIQGKRPARPTAMSNKFWSLVGSCWSQQSTARPTIQEVIKTMETENCVVRHDPARK